MPHAAVLCSLVCGVCHLRQVLRGNSIGLDSKGLKGQAYLMSRGRNQHDTGCCYYTGNTVSLRQAQVVQQPAVVATAGVAAGDHAADALVVGWDASHVSPGLSAHLLHAQSPQRASCSLPHSPGCPYASDDRSCSALVVPLFCATATGPGGWEHSSSNCMLHSSHLHGGFLARDVCMYVPYSLQARQH